MKEQHVRRILAEASEHAIDFYENLTERHVAATAGYDELRSRLSRPLPDEGVDGSAVIHDLVRDVEGGLLASGGGRFFGWVVGGSVPAALAADWLVSAWDQNAAIHACSPAEGILEEITGEWLKDILGIPSASSFAFTTGCQMAHFTALAAARHRLLAERGIDVERTGLFGAPSIRVLTGEHRHESVKRALRFLGFGTDSLRALPCGADGALDLEALSRELSGTPDSPTIVILQAGDIDTGVFDAFEPACALAHEHGAWVHVDGAFGLWAHAAPEYRHYLAGCEQADSWATDGHKWLNVPFDSGFVFIRDRRAHAAAMSATASYLIPPEGSARDQMSFNPEWSRRGRAVPAYAALRSLGRRGVAQLVERCCGFAERLVQEIGSLPGAEVVSPARINQGLVRFLSEDANHDRRTEEVMESVRDSGEAWFGGTSWRGMRAMRISVCSFRTTDEDVDRAVEAVRHAIAACRTT